MLGKTLGIITISILISTVKMNSQTCGFTNLKNYKDSTFCIYVAPIDIHTIFGVEAVNRREAESNISSKLNQSGIKNKIVQENLGSPLIQISIERRGNDSYCFCRDGCANSDAYSISFNVYETYNGRRFISYSNDGVFSLIEAPISKVSNQLNRRLNQMIEQFINDYQSACR